MGFCYSGWGFGIKWGILRTAVSPMLGYLLAENDLSALDAVMLAELMFSGGNIAHASAHPYNSTGGIRSGRQTVHIMEPPLSFANDWV
jgi:hypothetical protein